MKLPKSVDQDTYDYLMYILAIGKSYKLARIARESVDLFREMGDQESVDFWAALGCTAERTMIDETAIENGRSPGLDGNQAFGKKDESYQQIVWDADYLIPGLHERGELDYEIRVRFERALAFDRMGDYAESLREFQAALELALNLGDDDLTRLIENSIGPSEAWAKYGPGSPEFLLEVKCDLENRGDHDGTLRALDMLGLLWRERGDLSRARRFYQEMLEYAREQEDEYSIELAGKALKELDQGAGD